MDMADRIKERRIAMGYTQEELAQKLGLQKSAIAKYENGRVENIKRTVILNMANILETSPTYLMGWDDLEKELRPTKEEIKIIHKNSYENLVIAEMKKMNQKGKIKLLDTARDMTCNPLYNNNYKLEVDAAHARTDIDIPENIDTSDNDIMDDENF